MNIRTLAIIIFFSLTLGMSCGPKTGNNLPVALKIKYNQYYIAGKNLYEEHCSNCHHKDGSGLVRLYPPLKNSDFLNAGPIRTICIIRNGFSGELIVNGISFNQPMPGNQDLTNLEIAELVTYLYGVWGKEKRIYETEEISVTLEDCSSLQLH